MEPIVYLLYNITLSFKINRIRIIYNLLFSDCLKPLKKPACQNACDRIWAVLWGSSPPARAIVSSSCAAMWEARHYSPPRSVSGWSSRCCRVCEPAAVTSRPCTAERLSLRVRASWPPGRSPVWSHRSFRCTSPVRWRSSRRTGLSRYSHRNLWVRFIIIRIHHSIPIISNCKCLQMVQKSKVICLILKHLGIVECE